MRELCPDEGGTGNPSDTAADIRMTQKLAADHRGTRWYAVSVRHQHEGAVEKLLRFQGWETLVPTYRSRRQWSDRVREIELPLFSGYVFCRFAPDDRIRVEDTPGAGQIVRFNGGLAAIEEHEIAAIQGMVASRVPLTPWPFLKSGDRVRVERGPLKGIEGTLLRMQDGARLVLGIELLQRSVAAEVDPDMVVPVKVLSSVGR